MKELQQPALAPTQPCGNRGGVVTAGQVEHDFDALRGVPSSGVRAWGAVSSSTQRLRSLRAQAACLPAAERERLLSRIDAVLDVAEHREHEEAEADLRLHELGIEDHQAVPGATVRRQRHDARAHRALHRSLPAIVRRRGDRRLCGGRPRTRRTQRASRSSSSSDSDPAPARPPGLRVGLALVGDRA